MCFSVVRTVECGECAGWRARCLVQIEGRPLRAPLTGWLITNSLTCQQCAMHASQGKGGDDKKNADNKVGGGFGQVTMHTSYLSQPSQPLVV